MRLRASVVVVLGLLCPFITTAALAGNDTDTSRADIRSADEIIGQVAEAYKNCTTYRDSGIVTTLFIYPDGRTRTRKLPFTTAFVRPDRFRFEYQNRFFEELEPPGIEKKSYRYIIWRRGRDVRSWWDVTPGIESKPSLSSALHEAYGVSSRLSGEIPSLLLPQEISNSRLMHVHEVTRLEDAKLGDVNCIRIQGEDRNDDPITFWIDSQTLLVRRIDSGRDFGSFRTEETMTYDAPAMNEQIPEGKLAFDPPTEDAGEANLR